MCTKPNSINRQSKTCKNCISPHTKQFLLSRKIYYMARSRNVFILIDEAYSDFINEKFISMANIVPDKKGVIIINSLSKNLGISGWRIGYAISSLDIKDQIL